MIVKAVEFLIYVAGVVFISWHYYALKSSVDIVSFLVLLGFFLFGVSRFATHIVGKLSPKNGVRDT